MDANMTVVTLAIAHRALSIRVLRCHHGGFLLAGELEVSLNCLCHSLSDFVVTLSLLALSVCLPLSFSFSFPFSFLLKSGLLLKPGWVVGVGCGLLQSRSSID